MNRRSLLIGSTIVLTSLAGCAICFALQQKDRGVDVVVAAEDLQIGTKLDESVLQIVTLPSSLAPDRAYDRKSQVVGGTVTLPLIKDEVLLPRKVAAPDVDARLPPAFIVSVTVAIPAVSVRTNGVALADNGSLSRPTLADVLLAKSASGPRDPQADQIWPGVDVMAVTSRVEPSDGRDARLTPVVTLMMNLPHHAAEYGHKLALAAAQHRVWVALRNIPDTRKSCRSVSTQPATEHLVRPTIIFHSDLHGCCGQGFTADLKVFADGAVAYTEDSVTSDLREPGKPLRTQLSCATQLDTDEMRELSRALDSPAVRALPTKVLLYPEARQPIRLLPSEGSFEINRVDGTQEIQVELPPTTPPPISKPLTQLDCELEEILAKTIKSPWQPEGFVNSRCYEVLDWHSRPVITEFSQALQLLSSGRYSLQSVVLDDMRRASFVLMEKEDHSVSESEHQEALELSLRRAEFEERLKSDFGER